MVEVAKDTIKVIEGVIKAGKYCHIFEYDIIEEAEKILREFNKRKEVSKSSIKLYSLLLNTLLLIRNKDNFEDSVYVDTVSKLTYNRYQIKKHIEEEQIVLAKKIKETLEYFEMAENKIESIS